MCIVVYAVWWRIKDIIYKKNMHGIESFKVRFCRFNFYVRTKKRILWLPQSLVKLLLCKQRIKS